MEIITSITNIILTVGLFWLIIRVDKLEKQIDKVEKPLKYIRKEIQNEEAFRSYQHHPQIGLDSITHKSNHLALEGVTLPP